MKTIAAIGWKSLPLDFDIEYFPTLQHFLHRIELKVSSAQSVSTPTAQPRKTFGTILLKPPGKEADLRSQIEFLIHQTEPRIPKLQIILFGVEILKTKTLVELINSYPIVGFLESNDHARLGDLLTALLFTQRLEDQQLSLQNLKKEETVQHEFEYQNMIEELSTLQKKISTINGRILANLQHEKILHDFLMTVMTTKNIGEMELQLQTILIPLLGETHIRIILHQGATHPMNLSPHSYSVELFDKDQTMGQLVITPKDDLPISAFKKKIIENLAEMIGLQIPRLLASEDVKALEAEWRATFDAIQDPLIVINDDLDLIEANQSAKNRRSSDSQVLKKKCYEQIFGYTKPCLFCPLGKSGTTETPLLPSQELFEIRSQELTDTGPSLSDPPSSRGSSRNSPRNRSYIHLYRNIINQKKMEEKISQMSQEAEVGLFKASLAHELNNPIGGLLTLAQLQKMDLPKEDRNYTLFVEIESLAKQCRDLIHTLLQKSQAHEPSSRHRP